MWPLPRRAVTMTLTHDPSINPARDTPFNTGSNPRTRAHHSTAQFVVGIDLGTTHCVMASSRVDRPAVRLFEVPQLIAPGESAERPLLPSFLYLPAAGELAEHDMSLPWGTRTQIT